VPESGYLSENSIASFSGSPRSLTRFVLFLCTIQRCFA